MSKVQTRNDMTSAVPKFCHGLEAHRRTQGGRVHTPHQFVVHFFPHDEKGSTDRMFHFLPREVRGPILTAWGVRGQKSALRDTDDKVQAVVHDALVAGDVDEATFEDSLAPEVIIPWLDLADWWKFWRSAKLPKYSILKALESAYELGLFDGEWFLETLQSPGGKLRGTDVLADGLSKADLTEWVRAIYLAGDGSAKGLVAALGWDQIVAKTADQVLIAVLDAMAVRAGLAMSPEEERKAAEAKAAAEVKAAEVKPVELPFGVLEAVKPEAKDEPKLPGVLIPGTGHAKGTEQELSGEAAANMFGEDELIPIDSSPSWDAPEEAHGEAPGASEATIGARRPSNRPGAGKANGPTGKRPSKIPPAKAKG